MSIPLRALAIVSGVTALFAASWLPASEETATSVRVRVADPSGKPLPARLTVTGADGSLAELEPEKQPWIASRRGVIYTGTGEARFRVPPGRYTLYANRGLEYGLVQRPLDATGGSLDLSLTLTREVDTRGYVACDPHIHTLTHSGHGDATVEERMATIAGEGIELAISTEHNHHVDYAPAAEATRTRPHFTPVIGNEVTTPQGHFNAFPVRPGSPVPDAKVTDWSILLPAIRATPGVRVVVLNHPRNNHSGFVPTDPSRFHAGSGESLDERPWSFDGVEVVTSAALQSDVMKPYRDWFALLNRGVSVAGLGSSDSHEVSRFILGQGRTYVASTAEDASQIDVQEACDSVLAGRVLASLGLLTEIWVDGAASGGLSRVEDTRMRVRVRVQGPRWINADRLELYANGKVIASRPIVHRNDAVVKAHLTLELPRPKHDVWLVAVATGPGVTAPYWPTPRPYQPDRPDWEPRVLGSSGVVRVDGDRNGRYTSPYERARLLVQESAAEPDRVLSALSLYDEATAVQAASLLRARGVDLRSNTWRRAIETAPEHVRHGFVAYQNMLP
ncbi:MAG: CehA/McbA family metallohydrolase [Armatimonadota bacterium]